MNKIIEILTVLVILSSLIACDIDHGIAPLPGKVAVRVIFRNEPPANTQGIYLSVAPKFPPQAINQMYHSPNSLPIDRDTVYTEMALPFGHYEAVSLWWYNSDTETNFADVLGLPLDAANNLRPRDFTLTPENPVFEIDLYANWNAVKRDGTISGRITFDGPFPKNTQATAIAAYKYKPEEDIHYLVWLKSIDFSIGPDSRFYDPLKFTYDYTLPVRHGEVDYLAVFWLPEKAGMIEYQVLGVYPERLKILTGQNLTGIDINATWPTDE